MYRDVYGYYDTPCITSFNLPTDKVNEILSYWNIFCILLSVILVIDFIYTVVVIYEYCREHRKIKNKEMSIAYVV